MLTLRAAFLTAADPRWRDRVKQGEPLAALVMALIAVALILHGAGELPPAPMDQAFANVDLHISQAAGHWEFHYPVLAYSGGVSASLAIGVYKLLAPIDPAHLNYHVKLIACLYFLATTRWLARLTLPAGIDRVAAFALVAFSGLTYLEPSPEVLAAGTTNVFVCLLISNRWALAGLALAAFALVKIELVAVAAAMLICALTAKAAPGRRLPLVAGFAAGLGALLGPDVYLYGWRVAFLGREIEAFGAHYCALFHGRFSPDCLPQDLPQARNYPDILRLYPEQYLAFLAASSARGMLEMLATLNVSILAILFAPSLASDAGVSPKLGLCAWQLLVCLIATFGVATLFAFVHPRYLTRAYGLAAVVLVAASRRLAERPGLLAMRAWPALAVAANVAMLPQYLARPHAF